MSVLSEDETAPFEVKNVKRDHDIVALDLIKAHKRPILVYYDVEDGDAEEILEAIAIKLNKRIKGGEPDVMTAARMLLQEWQKGNI